METQARRSRAFARALALGTLLVVCMLILAACGDGGSGADVESTVSSSPGASGQSPTSSATSATATTSGPDGGAVPSSAVSFQTEDGLTLGGHLYGSGNWGVVLCHMYPADQTSWRAFAEELAQQGYQVLTFDFRGYGDSEGDKDIPHIDRDVTAAVRYLVDSGASEVVVIGASMGGTAALKAAVTFQAMSSFRFAGVATLSAPVEFQGLSAADEVPELVVPLLFIAAEDDVGAAGAHQLEDLSGGSGDLQIVAGSDHGTNLLTGAQADTVKALLLDFLQQNLEAGNL
jgi:pimeloyl-ACP methyl ester carboxylesterase